MHGLVAEQKDGIYMIGRLDDVRQSWLGNGIGTWQVLVHDWQNDLHAGVFLLSLLFKLF